MSDISRHMPLDYCHACPCHVLKKLALVGVNSSLLSSLSPAIPSWGETMSHFCIMSTAHLLWPGCACNCLFCCVLISPLAILNLPIFSLPAGTGYCLVIVLLRGVDYCCYSYLLHVNLTTGINKLTVPPPPLLGLGTVWLWPPAETR
jgi:hypothetical protein